MTEAFNRCPSVLCAVHQECNARRVEGERAVCFADQSFDPCYPSLSRPGENLLWSVPQRDGAKLNPVLSPDEHLRNLRYERDHRLDGADVIDFPVWRMRRREVVAMWIAARLFLAADWLDRSTVPLWSLLLIAAGMWVGLFYILFKLALHMHAP